jgi:serine/threonine protein kinase
MAMPEFRTPNERTSKELNQMSAEPKQAAGAEVWTRWENQVVNGVFPLRRLLGCSEHSAVFLTEYKSKNLPDAAIKLMRSDGLQAKAQLKHWKAAAALSHPHLVRLFEMGRCRSGQREFLFVVMEYAEQTLDQILRRRALSPDEVREILPPVLDALAFLHRHQRVHCQLRPSNFLAVNDQLKLASDSVRPAGHSTDGIVSTCRYDPPELNDCGASAAGDVWSLGMTLVEALTGNAPAGPDQLSETASLPASVPAPFVGLVRRCLSRSPANRPTVIELEAPFKTAARANSISDSQPSAQRASQKTTSPRSHRKRNLSLLAVAAALLISIAVWVRFSDTSQAHPQSSVVSAPTPVAPALIPTSPQPDSEPSGPVVPSPIQPSVPPEVTQNAALLEAKPNVPQDISEKIQRPIPVTLRVLVGPSGDVVGALMENPGPSKYLARLAEEAAREWKFAETDEQSARVWLLRFEFTREGVTAKATEQ